MNKLTASFMKKHLVKYNNFVKDELMVKGLSKMKREEIEKEFKARFKLYIGGVSGRKGYTPKDRSGFSPDYNDKEFYKIYEDTFNKTSMSKEAKKPADKKKNRKLKK